MKYIIPYHRSMKLSLLSISLFLSINGCTTTIGLMAGHADDKKKSSVDQTFHINQLHEIEKGKQIEIHSISGTVISGVFMGNELFIHDSSINLLLLKTGSNVARIQHSTIQEIRVLQKRKTLP